jgi:DNA polymerase I
VLVACSSSPGLEHDDSTVCSRVVQHSVLLFPTEKCILEWDGAEGEKPPVPLLKNMFANERRKAKVGHRGSQSEQLPDCQPWTASCYIHSGNADPRWCMAQVLNFSIAYGKTAHGLSKDFKTTLEEAQETVNKWYADRPEVR